MRYVERDNMTPASATAFSERPKARTTDPVTSHQAARSVANQSEVQQAILSALRNYGPMHDALLAEWQDISRLRVSESGLRTRRAELVTKGLVRDSGQRVRLPSGRSSIVWEATK